MSKVVTYAPARLEEPDKNWLAAGDTAAADVYEVSAEVSVDVRRSARRPSSGSCLTDGVMTFAGPVAVELSIVMPCLNEVRTLKACIRKACRFLEDNGISGEIIVADNGSTDGSVELASSLGARVLSVGRRGYGAALKYGIESARGRWVIMGDSDDSYDFSALKPFLDRLRAGDDLVVGNRYGGGIAPGAMPFLHRYLGNPFFSWWVRAIVGVPLRDVYCGLRGFSRAAIERLDLKSAGMEFALEMIVKSKLLGMKISEVPTTLACDGRDRPPHLNTWRDGRRSLLLLLASKPQVPFLYPGLALMLLGYVAGMLLAVRPISIRGAHFDVHTLVYCGGAVLVGFQLVAYSVMLRFLMEAAGLLPAQPRASGWADRLRFEHGLGAGLGFVLVGLAGVGWLLRTWQAQGFGNLDPFVTSLIAIPSATAIAMGFQMVFAALFLSLAKWHVRTRISG